MLLSTVCVGVHGRAHRLCECVCVCVFGSAKCVSFSSFRRITACVHEASRPYLDVLVIDWCDMEDKEG